VYVNWPAPIRGAYHQGDATGGDWIGSVIPGMQDASGLHYKRNRYYNPTTGQFTQTDPIGIAGGLNTYGFAEGDPVSYDDPYGLFKIEYGDLKANLQIIKLKETSPLIAQDWADMERHPDTFILERAPTYDGNPGQTWDPAIDDDGRTVRRVQMSPFGVARFALSPTVRARGGISELNVWAHEIHAHAGPAARGENCTDVGHALDSCGLQMENEWRAEQNMTNRTYGEVSDVPPSTAPLPPKKP
jgi:RHS repeat-associated protein